MNNSPQSIGKTFYNGFIKENPTFVLMLGMCPTLAVTTSAINGLGMGLTTTVVLTMSNIIISLLRKVIPDKVRIPAYIVIIASFVTIVGQFLEAYLPALNASLGMFIPLIVVNCIILGRAESFASKNGVLLSVFDGLGMGLGFTMALTIIGVIREILGAHKVFGIAFADMARFVHIEPLANWFDKQYPISIFVMAPGAFFVLAAIVAFLNYNRNKKMELEDMDAIAITNCKVGDHDCANCHENCEHRFYDADGIDGSVYEKNNRKTKNKSEKTGNKESSKKNLKENSKGKSKDKSKAKDKSEKKTTASKNGNSAVSDGDIVPLDINGEEE